MKQRRNLRNMVLAGSFAALTAVCAWISIPVGEIAFTLQTFSVLLTLGILGGYWGSISIGVYLLLGAVGLPVFSGFRGGLSMLLGPTGGYLLGFLAAGLGYWLATTVFGSSSRSRLAAMTAGLLLCYGFGSAWFLKFYAGGGSLSFRAVFLICVAPYLLPDGGKLILAHILTERLRRHLRF